MRRCTYHGGAYTIYWSHSTYEIDEKDGDYKFKKYIPVSFEFGKQHLTKL